MADIEFFDGDLLFDAKVEVVCHQTNCQGVMGAGIAKQIHLVYPRVFDKYQEFCSDLSSVGRSPLGSCQLVWTDESQNRIVANLFGQEYYGRDRQQTDYNALRSALHSLANHPFLVRNKMSLGFPYKIGCALGGGDWAIVFPMIREELKDYPGRVEIWRYDRS